VQSPVVRRTRVCSRAATGSPAPLPELWSNGLLATAVRRLHRA
jgi:hypothetical protein